MKQDHAVAAFAALAHEVRVSIYRLLVEHGPTGLAAGQIAERLGISPSSLTFHAAILERAGLLASSRAGRSVIYQADLTAMSRLVSFMTDQCCHGHPEVCRAVSTTVSPCAATTTRMSRPE